MNIRTPDLIRIFGENDLPVLRENQPDVTVTLSGSSQLNITVSADETPLCRVELIWGLTDSEQRKEPVRVLGDAWERGYGDLEWRKIQPNRCMPWFFMVSNGSDSDLQVKGRRTECFGVKVRPAAFCYWKYDGKMITLAADIRNGGAGVILKGRKLEVATVIFSEYCDLSAYQSGCSFAKEMCKDGIFPAKPVYGFNNWYYAYGNSSADEILSDTERLMKSCEGIDNPPYMVIDDGWQPNPCDGPWDRGNDRFPDMRELAERIAQKGAIPGIWIRPLLQKTALKQELPKSWRFARDSEVLDPSIPEVLDYVEANISRLVEWGYRLIKHDFTTFDIFGKWGMECPEQMGEDGWHFADRSKTTAEIILELYQRIRKSAGHAILIGCNTVSHLCAGLVEINRTGDDTSGKDWERTRKMGVNTLAFRSILNKVFYMCDADCVGITKEISWKLNQNWMKVLSQSGSPLFISWGCCARNTEIEKEVRSAIRNGSLQEDQLIPLDWMEQCCPTEWMINGEKQTVLWS